jgi:MFS family permease
MSTASVGNPWQRLQSSDTARVLISIYVPSMIMSFGQGMVVPTIPRVATTFDVSPGLAAQLVTATFLGSTLGLLPAGILIDRAGRRPLLIMGPLLLAAAAAFSAVTTSYPLFLAAQVLAGLGSSFWQLAREIAAVDVIQPHLRGRMMSGFHGMNSVGTAVGPLLGGIITDLFGFRAVFWTYGLMALITLAVSFQIRETAGSRRSARGPLINFGAFREIEPFFRATFIVITINTFVAMMRSTLFNSMVPLYVGVQLGYSSTEVGAVFAVYGLLNVLMIGPTGYFSDTRGRKAVVMPSAYLAVVAFTLFPFASQMWQLSALAALSGIAGGLALGTMATYSYDIIPDHARGSLQTIRRLFGQSGLVLGPVLAGTVADMGSPAAAFWLFVPLQLVSGLLITFIAKESFRRGPSQRAIANST